MPTPPHTSPARPTHPDQPRLTPSPFHPTNPPTHLAPLYLIQGLPVSDLRRAGVLARLLDPSNDPERPWLPCATTKWCAVYNR